MAIELTPGESVDSKNNPINLYNRIDKIFNVKTSDIKGILFYSILETCLYLLNIYKSSWYGKMND